MNSSSVINKKNNPRKHGKINKQEKKKSKPKDQKKFKINGRFFFKPFVLHELVIFNHGNFRCQKVSHVFRFNAILT